MDRDSQAFAALFQAHYSAICRYIAARAEADAVEDVAVDTFMVAWRRRDELPDQPRPWLLGTAAKCLANHRRSALRSARVGERLARQPRPVSASVEDALVRAEQGRALFAALTSLRDGDRELLLLHHWDGLAARDIAAGPRMQPHRGSRAAPPRRTPAAGRARRGARCRTGATARDRP